MTATSHQKAQQLLSLYEAHWPAFIQALRNAKLLNRTVSAPLLIDIDAHGYLNSPRKLMIVGQQTNYWPPVFEVGKGRHDIMTIDDFADNDPRLSIQQLFDVYKNFQLGDNYIDSPFWRFAWSLSDCIDMKSDGGNRRFLWTNLIKVDKGTKRPGFELEYIARSTFPVLTSEIQIAEPDVVVFLSGPEYDDVIRSYYPGAEFEPVLEKNVIHRGKNASRTVLVSKVLHSELKARAFRMYHPSYIQRLSSNNTNIREEILNIIVENSNK